VVGNRWVGLLHAGRVTWDLAWCPAAQADAPWCASTSTPPIPGCAPILGLLAAVHGDGRVAVYGVPNPDEVRPLPFLPFPRNNKPENETGGCTQW
jgi:hypothetical protein